MKTMSSDSSVSPDQPPETTTPAQDNGAPPESAVKFTRAASLWSSLTAGFLILIVLLIFITQNTSSAQFAFLGWRWTPAAGGGNSAGGGLRGADHRAGRHGADIPVAASGEEEPRGRSDVATRPRTNLGYPNFKSEETL